MKLGKGLLRWAASLALGLALTAAAGLGILDSADGRVSDGLYQRSSAADGEIVIIGMDDRAVELLGPMPWPRDVMADVIAILDADPEAMPAVIGVDVLYSGESGDPEADEWLAESCATGGNVVVAAAAGFESRTVEQGGSFYVDDKAVRVLELPYAALAEAAAVGHVNAMPDTDSILRHAMLCVDTPEGGRLYSFSRVIYEAWCEAAGEAPGRLPETSYEGFYYLPFTSGPRGYYDGISVADLLTGELDGTDFAGKIVLIGPYNAGMQDEYRTSISHGAPMYGVEIQANQIDAFRNGFFPREVSRRLQLGLTLLVCVLAAWWFYERRVGLAMPVWLTASAGWVGLCALAYRWGLILHVLWIPLFLTVIFIISVGGNYIRARREQRRITDTFGRYVDHAVLAELLKEGGAAESLGGKVCDIAVLFVDIRGFTTMSEALDAPTVVEIINMYLTLTTRCIRRYHGTLDKFVGDCTMAFWNAPVDQEDYIYLACKAAMDMVEGSRALGEELLARFGRTVSFGVGVNAGPAVIGNIGAPERMDFTAIGDTVNTAARLEANAPGGKVLISRAVADALGSRADTTSLGATIRLKGKAEGFEILTLDALR